MQDSLPAANVYDDSMNGSVVIAVRVSSAERDALALLAEREQSTVAAMLRRLVERAVYPLGTSGRARPTERRLRSSRVTIRVAIDDVALLDARAEARGLRAATYAATLLRAHLRSLAPLPVEEVRALKRLISELSAIGRNLNQIAHAANQGQTGRLTRDDLMGLLRVCEGLRAETKNLVRTNILSWEVGHATPDR